MDFWTFLSVVLVAAIAAIPPTIGAIAAFLVSVRNSRKLVEVHKDLNGRLNELVERAEEASFAKGVKQETDKQHPQ